MLITLNALQYNKNNSGIGQLIRNLYSELINYAAYQSLNINFDIIFSQDVKVFSCLDKDFISIKRIPACKTHVLKRNFIELLFLQKYIDKNSQIYFSTDAKLPLFMNPRTKKILMVTDLAVYRMQEVYQTSRSIYWKKLFKSSIKRADKIIAISEFTKKEIIDILEVSSDKISVVYMDANSAFKKINDDVALQKIKDKFKLDFPFILFVGSFSPRKNLYRLIKAFENLVRTKNIPHRLVIVGEKGWKFDKETKYLKESDISGKIIFPGYIADQDLPYIYNLADVCVYPSIYEGFGIPVVEAMACQTPVAVSNASSLPEIAGDAAIYFDPYNVEDMSDKIYTLLTDLSLQKDFTNKGIIQAQKFSWEKSAKALFDIFTSSIF